MNVNKAMGLYLSYRKYGRIYPVKANTLKGLDLLNSIYLNLAKWISFTLDVCWLHKIVEWKIIRCRRKIRTETFGLENIYPNATGLNMAKNSLFSIPKLQQMPISQGLLIWTICRPLKNEDAETSPFSKLALEISKCIVYNHHRSNQRIFAVSDDCHRKLNNGDFKLNRLSPIAVGDGQFIFYGDCRDM